MNWKSLIRTLAPLVVSAVVPGVGPVLGGLIAHGIEEAEQLKGSSSQEKLDHAINIVTDGIGLLNTVKPDTISPIAHSDIISVINKTVDAVNQISK